MKKKRSPLKDLVFLSLSSFVVIVAWVGFNLYHSWVTTTITPELQIQIIPISPDFDTVTLEKLKSRMQVAPINALSNQNTVSPTPAFAPQSPSPTAPATPLSQQTTTTVQSQLQPSNIELPVTRKGQ